MVDGKEEGAAVVELDSRGKEEGPALVDGRREGFGVDIRRCCACIADRLPQCTCLCAIAWPCMW